MYGQCIFLLFKPFFRFWTLIPIADFDSFHYNLEESVCSKFSFDFSLGHQITLSEVDVIDCDAHSIVVGFVFVKIHSSQNICMGVCSPGVYFNSWSKPIRAIAHLVILDDAVFGISSGAKRYLSGLWSICRVNCLLRGNCFYLLTTNTIASASRSMFE